MKVYLYPTPLHYRQIPDLIDKAGATVLLGADTFLADYARNAGAFGFRSLRYVIAGAEAVKAETRRLYMEKFGLRILEGYGVTEASPVLAVNSPAFNKIGTVGRFLPFVEPRIEPVSGIDEGGRLIVRGPNIMIGYYRADNPGELEPPPGGWHDTGDIVTIDEAGLRHDKGPRQALRQDRRRNRVARGDRGYRHSTFGPIISRRRSPRRIRREANA